MNRFGVTDVTSGQLERINDVRKGFEYLERIINELMIEGREKSLCMTKLEEACMWAVKGISRE